MTFFILFVFYVTLLTFRTIYVYYSLLAAVFLLPFETAMFSDNLVCFGGAVFSDSCYSPSVFGDPFSLASKAGLD